MGTASYMAPEQADDSSTVDHRADIYALGCTFYVLLTGRPPFSGTTIDELITKHRSEKIVRPELIVDRIDPKLSDIVIKMVSKNPDDRYADMGQLIKELEAYLGISSDEVFSPGEQQVELLEKSRAQYDQVPLAKVRRYIPMAFAGFCIVAMILAQGIKAAVTPSRATLWLLGVCRHRRQG